MLLQVPEENNRNKARQGVQADQSLAQGHQHHRQTPQGPNAVEISTSSPVTPATLKAGPGVPGCKIQSLDRHSTGVRSYGERGERVAFNSQALCAK